METIPFSCPAEGWKGGSDAFHSKSHLHDEFEHEQGSELRVSSWTSFCPAGRMSSGADFPESFVIVPSQLWANVEILLCRLHQSAQLQAKKITGKNKQPKPSRGAGRCTKARWDSPTREQQGHPLLNLTLLLASIHTSWKIKRFYFLEFGKGWDRCFLCLLIVGENLESLLNKTCMYLWY